MIASDQEFTTTQKRIIQFQRILGQLHVTARPEEFPSVTSGYLQDLERMHDEFHSYVRRSNSED